MFAERFTVRFCLWTVQTLSGSTLRMIPMHSTQLITQPKSPFTVPDRLLKPDCTCCELFTIVSHSFIHCLCIISNIDLTPLEIIYNKPKSSILLHVKDGTTRNVLILFLQEVKQDIVFRHAQLTVPRRWEEPLPRIQAQLLSVIALFEYQGVIHHTSSPRALVTVSLTSWSYSFTFIHLTTDNRHYVYTPLTPLTVRLHMVQKSQKSIILV
jgi:hypothetical protein